jgi:hypothetical protein|tara:strand:+ start:730 stop:891 length:162 start_codon:yes stop_codon:yes gene_type:complete
MPRKKKEKTMEDIIDCIRDDLDLLEQKLIDSRDDEDEDMDDDFDDMEDNEEDE